jgi:hypothetical protein
MPLEVDQIPAEGVTPGWQWQVSFLDEPTVSFDPKSKVVWVNHEECCGAGKGPRTRCMPYVRRHAVNKSRMQDHYDKVLASMKAMHARYASPTTYTDAVTPIEET